MMTYEQITAWAQDSANENHNSYRAVMTELALIENLKGQLHDHDGVPVLRNYFMQMHFNGQVRMTQEIARELNKKITTEIGGDRIPPDEFFADMRTLIVNQVKRRDPNGPVGMVVIDERLYCIDDMVHYMNIQLCLQSCTFLINQFEWDKLRAHEVADQLISIRDQLMTLFEQSVNYEFRIKGSPLIDVVEGVDWEKMKVKGRKYGDFAVDLCELRGYVRAQKDSLN